MPIQEPFLLRRPLGLLVIALATAACQGEPPAEYEFIPVTPHETYEYSFRKVGLQTSTMGHAWIAASQQVLKDAARVDPPFQEVGFFDPQLVTARAFRFEATRGQRIMVSVNRVDAPGEVFVDVYRETDDPVRPHRHVASADSGTTAIDLAVPRTSAYVVRIQSELLAAGRFDITIRLAAVLSFPVEGHGVDAVRSGFGASRDGGRREHQGVDIFAPRGTPVVASITGRVSSTRPNNLGGRVVWLRTEFGSLYHAHLDSVAVQRGEAVSPGDTLGFVGNSGNARTTPPHLHFGIYARRPTDPGPYLRQPPQTPPVLLADTSLLGTVGRSARRTTVWISPAANRSAVVTTLEADVPLTVAAASGPWFHVLLPDGRAGFVAARDLEPLRPLGEWVANADWVARASVAPDAFGTMAGFTGDTLTVVGRFNSYVMVVHQLRKGWVRDRQADVVADES